MTPPALTNLAAALCHYHIERSHGPWQKRHAGRVHRWSRWGRMPSRQAIQEIRTGIRSSVPTVPLDASLKEEIALHIEATSRCVMGRNFRTITLPDELVGVPESLHLAVGDPLIKEIVLVIRDGWGGNSSTAMKIVGLLEEAVGRGVKVVTWAKRACSAHAVVLTCAPGRRLIHPKGELMLHNSSGVLMGDAEEMERFAAFLRHLNTTIVSMTAARSGLTRRRVRDLHLAGRDTVVTAEAAKALGLVDDLGDCPL